MGTQSKDTEFGVEGLLSVEIPRPGETSVYFPGWQKEKGSPGRRKEMYKRIITKSERRQGASEEQGKKQNPCSL